MTPDEREPKLPKWAQAELQTLRRMVREERKVNDELRGYVPDPNTFVRDYVHGDTPLPRDARIAFHLSPDDGRVRNSIGVNIENGKLRVQGDYLIVVRPSSGNSLTIEMEK